MLFTRFLQVTTMDRMVRYHIKEWEELTDIRLPACSNALGRQVFTTLSILDLEGLGMKQFNTVAKDFVKTISRLDQVCNGLLMYYICEMVMHFCYLRA